MKRVTVGYVVHYVEDVGDYARYPMVHKMQKGADILVIAKAADIFQTRAQVKRLITQTRLTVDTPDYEWNYIITRVTKIDW